MAARTRWMSRVGPPSVLAAITAAAAGAGALASGNAGAGRAGGWLLAAAFVALLAAWRRADLARVASVEHHANDIAILFDHNLNIIQANDRALECYGYTHDEFIGLNGKHIRDSSSPTAMEEIAARLERDGGAIFESLHRRKDGSTFPAEVSLRRIRARGRLYYLAVERDITGRKRADQELERALASARETTELKSRFLANMSHEIRTPIHGVLGMTELLLCTRLDSEQREYADAVRRSAHALLAVINDILDLSKIEAGKLELEHIVFDVWSTVEEVASLLAFRACGKNLELTCLIQPDVPRLVRGDPARLRQVLTNLVGNAVKFTQEGEVGMVVEAAAGEESAAVLRFTVRDTGIGISAGQRERLFESFAQGDASTTRRYGGSGLGLAISRHLVERMGGRIEVESEPGEGSTFRFTAVLEREPGGPPAASPDLFAGLRVLAVEDKPTSRMILRRYLDSWGCRSEEAADTARALELLREAAARGDPFRAVVIDLHMAGQDGFGLASAVLADPALRGAILVGLTSVGRVGEAGRLREAGFAASLAKPVRPSQLFSRLQEVLHAGSAQTVPQPQSRTLLAPRPGRAVLLAEDNEINQKIVIRLLEKAGCRAERVANGREAVEAVSARHFDLVLMDVQMPEMDGFAATAEIRRREGEARHTPIAAMTANAMTGDREKCLAAGMDDYISKPVRLEDLQRMLNRWLSGCPPSA